MHLLLVAVAIAIQSTGQPDETAADGDQKAIQLPLLARKLVVADNAAAFSIGVDRTSDFTLAACDRQGRLSVAFSRWNRGKILSTDLPLEKPPRLLLVDINADETLEVLVAADRLRIYRVTSDRLSLVWTSTESFDKVPAPRLGTADFNGDGRIDIALLNYKPRDGDQAEDGNADTQSLYIYLNQADGKFSLSGALTLTDEHQFHSTSGLAIADFDGDQRPDIAVGNDNGWLWLIPVADGKPAVKTEWKVPAGGAIGPGLAAGNFDDQAGQELLVGTNGGDIFVYQIPTVGRPHVLAKAHAGRLAYGVAAADIDRDGRDEFLLARGALGYARMTQKDVATEIWTVSDDKLRRVWYRPAVGFVRPALMPCDINRDGTTELIIYTRVGDVTAMEVVTPVLSP